MFSSSAVYAGRLCSSLDASAHPTSVLSDFILGVVNGAEQSDVCSAAAEGGDASSSSARK